MKRLFYILGLLSTFAIGFAQCPPIDFTVQANACLNETVVVEYVPTGSESFEWDFCGGSLGTTPLATASGTGVNFSNPFDLTTVQENGVPISFVASRNNNKIFRMEFLSGMNQPPIISEILQLTSMPQGIEAYEENGIKYALVTTFNGVDGKLILLTFGSTYLNIPTVSNIGTGFNDARHVNVVKSNSKVYILIPGTLSTSNNGMLYILDMGSSITNSIQAQNNVPVGVFPTGLVTVNECGNWYVFLGGLLSGLHRLEFGSDLLSTPIVTDIPGVTGPFGMSFDDSGENKYLFVSSSTNLQRLEFGNSFVNPPSITDLGNFGLLINAIAFELVPLQSKYYAIGINYGNDPPITVLDFPKNCAVTNNFLNVSKPQVSYSAPGTYKIKLKVKFSSGITSTITKDLVVQNLAAPDIAILSQNICANHDIIFTAQNSSGNIIDHDWTFGDGGISDLQNPTYQYTAAGEYSVELTVTTINCQNFVRKTITIYNQPIADFTTPSVSPICTNQNFIFDNTSTFDVGYVPTWEWKVNGASITNNEDLSYTFLTTANQEIRLKASIPGCENEMIKNISTLVDGPVTDFSFSGQCEDTNVMFTNNSSGDGYSWDFDDGQSSSNTNPTHIFSTIGTYDVTLTATNTITACNNTKTKSVPIYTKPLVNFLLSPPPFSCNGTPSQFNDLTPTPPDSNIASWAWNFGDAGSSQNTATIKNPQHTYANAGGYNVSLLVTTNFSCSATIQLPVTISQTPVANFNHTPTCVGVQANFSDASVGTIDGWNWLIGSTAYTSQNPTHIFNASGSTSATLTVTATNDCIGTVIKPIVVPVKLTADFIINRNCVNQQTVFTDVTIATTDPITSQSWNFGTFGTATGSPANFTFPSVGNVPVTMTITTQSGCSYPSLKQVSIIPSPQASFTASPLVGAPPLSVQFTNTSVNATSYQWAFHDQNNSTSSAVSPPPFVYPNLGEYQPELTASNAQNCFHTTSRTIRVVVPVVDVALGGLELMEFQNGFKPAVTIFNRGNVPIINLPLLLNMSGPVIREYVNAIITPNTSYRHVLSFEFPTTSDIDYFCVEAEITDITPSDNEVCLNLDQSFITFPPYPNPAKASFQLDWITKETGIVTLTVINSMGQEERNLQIESAEGLNPLIIETRGLSSGVYFVKIKYQQFSKVYRVFVSE